MGFIDSLAFEIATANAELDDINKERKKLMKKIRALSQLLEETNNHLTSEEKENV